MGQPDSQATGQTSTGQPIVAGPNASSAVQADSVDDTVTPPAAAADVPVRTPTFASLQAGEQPGQPAPLDRFYDVNVEIWAELGRVVMSIGELLQLGDGSVLKLNRPASQPVDLVAQGVRLARGEVVIVDDNFAVRITEIDKSGQDRI